MGATAAPQIIGRYSIYGKIASGGMASVHFGRLLGGAGFSRTVAIKRLHPHLAEDPEFLSTMIDEARLAARIHHPNVVPTLDVVAADRELLLVMEYVRGESLSRLLNAEASQQRRVPLHIASAIMVGALHGLHAAHEATSDRGAPLGLVHRDISPQNILVGVDGMARVIDFGVAKAAGRIQTTQEGTIKGKMAYMAPEQMTARAVTRTADVYAMGVVLWETLAGRRLFQGPNDPRMIIQVLAGVKELPSKYAPDIPTALDGLVMRALSIHADHRYPTAREMADELTRIVPPALPTEVGAWCAEVARESLEKRESLLADIESSSGVVAVPSTPASANVESGPIALTDMPASDEMATLASQPSNLSMATPKPAVMPSWAPRHAVVLAGGLGAGLLFLAGGFAAVSLGRTTEPVTSTPSAGASLAAVAETSEAPAAPTPPAAPSATPSAEPEGVTTSHPSARPRSPLSSPARPRPPSNCVPNYTYDPAGHKHFKPECFQN